jgi:predicted signal transduction protein with EAL and GGDEF domain
MLRRADESLYAAKHAGRDRVMVHDGEICRQPPPLPAARSQTSGADEPAALLDRPAFFQELRHRLAECKQTGGALSLLLLEAESQDGGEEDFGRRLLTAVRQGDRAARFADRQFAVLLPNAPRGTAEKVAERIVRQAHVAPRIGLVEAKADEEAIPLVQRAARALTEDQASLTSAYLAK